jgi:hypothetical protein
MHGKGPPLTSQVEPQLLRELRADLIAQKQEKLPNLKETKQKPEPG